MDDPMSLAMVLVTICVFIAGTISLVSGGSPFDSNSRTGRLANCFFIGSALALLYMTGVIHETVSVEPLKGAWPWAGLLLLASLFCHNIVLEIASWFGAK
jgi:hypothetical protein